MPPDEQGVKPEVEASPASTEQASPSQNDVKQDVSTPSVETKQDVKQSESTADVVAKVIDNIPKDEPVPSTEKQSEEKKNEVKEEPLVPAKEEPKHEQTVPYQRFDEVNRKAKEFEEPATRMRAIEQYCAQHQITPENFTTALDLLAAMNTDPKKAREILMPLVEKLNILTGEGIPGDLQQEVTDGIMTIERAKELAKLRLSEQSAAVKQKQYEAQLQGQRQQALNNALTSWIGSKQKLHTEFKAKGENGKDGPYEAFLRRFNHYWGTVPVHSPEEAVALAERAFAEEQEYVKQFMPALTEQKLLRSTGSSKTAEVKIDTSKEGWGRGVAQQVLAQYS